MREPRKTTECKIKRNERKKRYRANNREKHLALRKRERERKKLNGEMGTTI